MLRRALENAVRVAVSDRPVVLIQGPRQCGKTTLAKLAAPNALYVNLDDSVTYSRVVRDTASFVRSAPGTMIIDEVQRVPELLRAIKVTVDEDRRPGRFLLTGSANLLTVPRVSESLAGRIEIITLSPLSQGELEGTSEGWIDHLFNSERFMMGRVPALPPTLEQRVLRGGFPELVLKTSEDRRQDWFASYLSTLIQRDIRDIVNIDDVVVLPRLVELLASRTSGLLNYTDIARTLAIPQTTVRRYINLLQLSFLVTIVRPWSTNTSVRLSKAPKVYFNDTGLAAHALEYTYATFDAPRSPKGPLVENFVVTELMKQASWSRMKPLFLHLRAHTGEEVDIVLEGRGQAVVGIEIKSSRTLSNNDFKGLRTLASLAGPRFRRGIVFYTGEQLLPFGDDMYAVPIHALWTPLRPSPP